MKKETIIAVFLGITFGVVLSLFMVSRTKRKSTSIANKKNINEANQIVTPISQSGNVFSFEVSTPSNNIIVNKKIITISGKSSISSLIMIQSPIKDLIVNSEKSVFSTDFPLALGENVIHIVAYPKDTQYKSQEKELRVYYIDE
jgi:hypothetical protein